MAQTQTRNKMQKYADKYFLRSNEVLKAANINPWINMQLFVRKGPGKIMGIEEAIELTTQNSNIVEAGGRIYAKDETSLYKPKETVMNIIAPIQEIMELETIYLGVISTAVTLENDKKDIDLNAIQRNVEQIVELAGGRDVFHFGARHWHYLMDRAISEAAFRGGVVDCSTDNGAGAAGKEGVGTIPHALENIFAYYHGVENAVAKSTEAFHKHMPLSIPRIALVDYANREITDTLATAKALEENGETKLNSVRVDTCGENIAEGGVDNGMKYWTGKGVSVCAVAALRKAMNQAGLEDKVGIVLSSGFSNPDKLRAFNEGERLYDLRLYDTIGAGFLDDVRTATADIIAVGESPDEVDYFKNPINPRNVIHKVGRPPRYNYDLKRKV